jgi:hypothetical protein
MHGTTNPKFVATICRILRTDSEKLSAVKYRSRYQLENFNGRFHSPFGGLKTLNDFIKIPFNIFFT